MAAVCRYCLCLLTGIALACVCVPSCADTVKMDLLGGLGDFEWGHTFYWASEGPYSGDDYDWGSQTDEFHLADRYNWGFNTSTVDEAVAIGWKKTTGPTVNPGRNAVFRIANGAGIGSTNCQFFALRGITSGNAYIRLEAPRFKVSNAEFHDLHTGDTVTFQVDHVQLADYSGLPPGSRVEFKLILSWEGGQEVKVLPRSAGPLHPPDTAVTCVVPSGVTEIRALIVISTSGDLGMHQPGMYVDGAHLYVRRAGQSEYETETVPIVADRRLKTSRMFFVPTCDTDVYRAAREFDVVVVGEHHAAQAARLRYYNRGIKVYLYLLANIRDGRFEPTQEPVLSGNALSFLDVLNNHVTWLYPYTKYPYSTPDSRYPIWKRLTFKFESQYPESPTYYTRIADAGFQAAWARGAIEKVSKYRMDGVWIDALVTSEWDMPDRKPWELQSFVHGVVPVFRNAGLSVVVNGCSEHFDVASATDIRGLAGAVKFDPWWQPTPAQATEGYRANSPSNTIDSVHQEWAFMKPATRDGVTANSYDREHWLRCLKDMDAVRDWNLATGANALTQSQKKWLHMQVSGVSSQADPAAGQDGWVNFGLCSYLLAQNEWTTFGCAFHQSRDLVDLDLVLAGRLGVARGTHQAYAGDPYVRYRIYEPDERGGRGGVVVVNAHPDASRDYAVPFDVIDGTGRVLTVGEVVTLRPHTGRILLRKQWIEIAVDVPTQSVRPGQQVTIAVRYHNPGPANADDVTVAVTIPSGLTYSLGSAEATGGVYEAATRVVRWNIGGVAAGDSGTRTFTAHVE